MKTLFQCCVNLPDAIGEAENLHIYLKCKVVFHVENILLKKAINVYRNKYRYTEGPLTTRP